MKKLFMFLSAMAFITQAHAVQQDEFYEFTNSTKKKLTVNITVDANDHSPYGSFVGQSLNLILEPGERDSFRKSMFGSNFDINEGYITSIRNLTIYDHNEGVNVYAPAHFYKNYKDLITLIITDDLLQAWKDNKK